MYPYIDPQAFANEQAMLQQRINQLEQARNQQMSMYAPQSQQQPQAPTSNVMENTIRILTRCMTSTLRQKWRTRNTETRRTKISLWIPSAA